MRVFFKRKIIKVGDSMGITIPYDIVNTYELKEGQTVTLVVDVQYEDGLIAIDIKGRNATELHKYLDNY